MGQFVYQQRVRRRPPSDRQIQTHIVNVKIVIVDSFMIVENNAWIELWVCESNHSHSCRFINLCFYLLTSALKWSLWSPCHFAATYWEKLCQTSRLNYKRCLSRINVSIYFFLDFPRYPRQMCIYGHYTTDSNSKAYNVHEKKLEYS